MSIGYHLSDLYDAIVLLVRESASDGMSERWGVTMFRGIPDFRLNYGKYRVIELAPLATRIAVFMEWRKVFIQQEHYATDPDFLIFEDAFGYLGINENWHQPWNVNTETDLSDPYVRAFLTSGMALMMKDIQRRHPAVCKYAV